MILLKSFEFLLGVFIAIGLASQIIIPAFQGRPLFPAFRRATRLQEDIVEAEEEVREAKLERKLHSVEKEAERVRQGENGEEKP